MSDGPDLSQLLAAMYDCAIVPDLWPRVLPEMADYMNSPAAFIGVRNRVDGTPPSLMGCGIDPMMMLELYVPKYRAISSRIDAVRMFGVDEPVRIEDVFGAEEFRQTRFYKEMLFPRSLAATLGAKIIDNTQRSARFGVIRRQPYSAPDVQRFRTLCPHIRRVLTISDLLEQRTAERDTLAEIVDHLAAPVIMVDPKQRIVHSNMAAQEFLAEGKSLSSVRGVLTASNPRNQEGLRRVTRAPDLDAKSLALESEEGPVTVATVLPLTGGLRASHGKHLSASAAIFVHNQLSFDERMIATLATAFGLTGAEARVLSALLEGLSIAEAAARFQISVNTVRWHLKRLFEKTNTKRQGDLIRLASCAIPQVRSARDGERLNNLH